MLPHINNSSFHKTVKGSLQLGTFRPSVCVAPFRFHLGLNKVHRCESHTHVPWAYMCCVNEVCWLPDHGAIDSSPPFRLWLLCNAAAETNPELSHSEADKEATAVSSLSSDVSLRLSSCSVLAAEPQTHAGNWWQAQTTGLSWVNSWHENRSSNTGQRTQMAAGLPE